ncbi:PREDICTED: uncharacterized protein LOC104800531 [Tarenaya hassleriana]|uniref:uncharacterized protein LOC104800531 n=1 Tax=Tarenaya hassleriana TaxID=28532 RepID=UPI00053C8951|nr:PREDICTED: uncharacterized protein LOC104800531 [Tarenaya hassleriana]
MNSSLKLFGSYSLPEEMTSSCRLSDPCDPHKLRIRLGTFLPPYGCSTCGKSDSYVSCDYHLYCESCDLQFHEWCHRSPRKLRHPFHIQHPLTSTRLRSETLVTDGDKCDWCGQDLGSFFYRCSVCTFSLDSRCAWKYPFVTITSPKSHGHALTLLPRPLSVPCDACGVTDVKDPAYVCLPCNYFVHQSCLNLPRVIKLTRHPCRLSHTPCFPHENMWCQICYRKVDAKHGAYSCIEGCHYFLHSKCATRKEIWDGRELEWETEETSETDDIKPFEEIGDGEILHFSHEHSLRLIEEDSNVLDGHKQCQACVLPTDSDNFYSCIQCGFFLHTACAGLPRKKEQTLHNHPLILDPLPRHDSHSMSCSTCGRITSGFMYKCADKNCRDGFQVDVRCASVLDSVVHECHRHPLFICLGWSPDRSCGSCGKQHLESYLKCIDECDFILCFECTTIPTEVRYKYDKHPLLLCCGEEEEEEEEEEAASSSWCEVCERKLNQGEWFYGCDKCMVTVHVLCVFGQSVYMKAGHCLNLYGGEVKVVCNNSSTRPVCSVCGRRCSERVFFEVINGGFLCSLHCSLWVQLASQMQSTSLEGQRQEK